MQRIPHLIALITLIALFSCAASCGSDRSGKDEGADLETVLAEVESLEAPADVDPALFDELKASLASALRQGGKTRFTSAVPSGAAGQVSDLAFSGELLRWTYVNRGDYDQNSEVNGADIAPIAATFRKGVADEDWNDRAVWVDGDGNGEVNGADIVPIAGNFRGTVEGYRIEVSANGTGGWSLAASAPFSASFAQGAWRVFAQQLDAPQHENWYRVVPFEGAALGAPSNAVQYAAPVPQIVSVSPLSGREGADVQFSAVVSGPAPDTYSWDFGGGANPDNSSEQSPTVTLGTPGSYGASLTVSNAVGEHTFPFTLTVNPNQPPQASFTATPQSGSPGQVVQLDATASFDPDGSLAHYEWDLDGDGTFETDGGVEPMQATALPDPVGSIEVGLRVTDDLGAQDTTSLDLTSSDPGGGTWLTLAVDTASSVGAFTSLAVVNGKPAISYWDGLNSDLKYAYSSTADGSSGWTAIPVDTDGDVGAYTSLAVVNGKPAISYYDLINGDLKYAHSSTADGSSGWTAIPVDTAVNVGAHTSLAVVNGKPAISYYDSFNGDLKYAYSSTADGSSGWTAIAVDTPGSVGSYTSLAVVNGMPAISYWDLFNKDLKYAYSSTADGSNIADWTAITVDTAGNVGEYTSLAVVNGMPAISYRGGTDLKYAYSSTADGSSGWTAIAVDTPGSVGYFTSLAVVNGKPAISYLDFTNADLKYAHSSTDDGSSDWTAIAVDTDDVGWYTSLAVLANGQPAISYGDRANSDLKYAVLMP